MEYSIKQLLDLAVSLHNNGELEEAELVYRKILDNFPNNPDALHLSGLIAYQREQYERAAELIEQAIQSNPNNALYHGNLGMVYDLLGREEESVKSFQKALEIDSMYPNSTLAYYNLGISFVNNGNFSEALNYYNKAIGLNENFYDAYWNRGLILLLLGKYKEGFKDYEYRFKKKNPTDKRIFNKPKWNGSPLNGKKILILSEQGFGDAIQFSRYLPIVKKMGGYIILECKKEIRNLFENLPCVDEIIVKENKVPEIIFDCYIHLMSLPNLLFEEFGIPNETPLKANPSLREKFRNKMDKTKINVGICWAGNSEQEDDWKRSTSFEKFKALLDISGIKFYSLQKGEASKQINDSRVIDLSNEIENFSDTAGIIENLDLVISVDTSVAHLAGAMGKPVWTLLSAIPDWRWLLEGETNLWYPTMKLFRQKKMGDWYSVWGEVKKELVKVH